VAGPVAEAEQEPELSRVPDAVLDPLADLGAAARRAHAAAHEARVAAEMLAAAVRAARENGASWATIGAATGMTRQAAHERWRSVAA